MTLVLYCAQRLLKSKWKVNMSFLRRTLDSIHPHVTEGGKYKKFYALYEAVDTVFYSPSDVNKGRNHVRDAIDLK